MCPGGFEMTMVSNNVPGVLMAVGSAYAIHVINCIDQVKSSIRKKAVTIALSSVTIPVFIAAITTIAGFLVLLFSEMVPLEYFGLLIAPSMFASGLGTLTLLPAILILSNKKHISLV